MIKNQIIRSPYNGLDSDQNISGELEKFVSDGSLVFKNQVLGLWNYSYEDDEGFTDSGSEKLVSDSYGKIKWITSTKVNIGCVYSDINDEIHLDMNFVFEVFDKWLQYSEENWDKVTSPSYYPIKSLPFEQGLLFYVISEIYKNIDRSDPNYSEDVEIDIALQIGRVLKFCLCSGEMVPHETTSTRMMKIFGVNPDPDKLTVEMINDLKSLSKDVSLSMTDKFYSKFIIDGLKSFSEYSGYPLNNLYTYNALILGENSPLANEDKN